MFRLWSFEGFWGYERIWTWFLLFFVDYGLESGLDMFGCLFIVIWSPPLSFHHVRSVLFSGSCCSVGASCSWNCRWDGDLTWNILELRRGGTYSYPSIPFNNIQYLSRSIIQNSPKMSQAFPSIGIHSHNESFLSLGGLRFIWLTMGYENFSVFSFQVASVDNWCILYFFVWSYSFVTVFIYVYLCHV